MEGPEMEYLKEIRTFSDKNLGNLLKGVTASIVEAKKNPQASGQGPILGPEYDSFPEAMRQLLIAQLKEQAGSMGSSYPFLHAEEGPILTYLKYIKTGKVDKKRGWKAAQEIFGLSVSKQEPEELSPLDNGLFELFFCVWGDIPAQAKKRVAGGGSLVCTAYYRRFAKGDAMGIPKGQGSLTCATCKEAPHTGVKICKEVKNFLTFIHCVHEGEPVWIGPVVWEVSGQLHYKLFLKDGPFQLKGGETYADKVYSVKDIRLITDGNSLRVVTPGESRPSKLNKVEKSSVFVLSTEFKNAMRKALEPSQQEPDPVTEPEEEDTAEEDLFGDI